MLKNLLTHFITSLICKIAIIYQYPLYGIFLQWFKELVLIKSLEKECLEYIASPSYMLSVVFISFHKILKMTAVIVT